MDHEILKRLINCQNLDLTCDCTDDYRALRNFTTCVEHQDILNRFLCDGNLDLVIKRLEHLANPSYFSLNEDLEPVQLRCGVQFLGNLVSNHYSNKLIIWKSSSILLRVLLNSTDLACRKYALMVFYNCVLDVPQHCREIVDENDLSTIISILNITFDDNCEWGLYILEQLLTIPGFIQKCCNDSISKTKWSAILQLIHSIISKDNSTVVDIDGIFFLEQRFIRETDFVLSIKLDDCQAESLREIFEILEVLCAATSADRYHLKMKTMTSERRPTVLLCHTIALLKSVHLVTQMQPTPKDKTVEELCNYPTYNFQKGLITLVANLCYKCSVIQDKLREVDGISLLLDCCKLNAKIPFITQWVVFAIRNACDDNKENQDLIAQMNKLGFENIDLDIEKTK